MFMPLKSLDAQAVHTALAHGRLVIRSGPFATAIRSPLELVRRGLTELYASHPARIDDGEDAGSFVDFHIEVGPVAGVRRWIKRQITFRMDGVEPFKPLPAQHAFAILEWGLNWCVASFAHRWLMLHAAVLARGNEALVMPAPPGSGKSTLCAALAHAGWRLLSDELVVLDPSSGAVSPLVRPINIKNASIAIVRERVAGAIVSNAIRDTRKGTIAHVVPPADAVARMHEPAKIRWIVFPRWLGGAPATLSEMDGSEVFEGLVDNAFNYDVHGEAGFRALTRAATEAAGFRFEYGDLAEAVQCFERLP